MIAHRFLAYVETAPWQARAGATGLLAQAYLRSSLPDDERSRVEAAMTAMLDDESSDVRRALAEALADSGDAPRHILAALAADEPEIARIVLERSPLLTSAELVDAAGFGRADIHLAIAGRAKLPAPVSAALAQVGSAEVALRLLGNAEAVLPAFSLESILRRHGSVAGVARAVIEREGVPREILLLAELAEAERAGGNAAGAVGAVRRNDAEFRDAADSAVIRRAVECTEVEMPAFVAFIRRSELVTAGLILRLVLEGHVTVLAAVLGDLASIPLAKAKGLVEGPGFWILYRKADLPEGLKSVFEAALAARPPRRAHEEKLCRGALAEVLSACAEAGVTDAHPVVCMLRRMDLAMAREAARETRRRVVAEIFMEAPVLLRPSLSENERIEALASETGGAAGGFPPGRSAEIRELRPGLASAA